MAGLALRSTGVRKRGVRQVIAEAIRSRGAKQNITGEIRILETSNAFNAIETAVRMIFTYIMSRRQWAAAFSLK